MSTDISDNANYYWTLKM